MIDIKRYIASIVVFVVASALFMVLPAFVYAGTTIPSSVLSSAEYGAQLAKVQQDIQANLSSGDTTKALDDLAPVVRCPIFSQDTIINVDNRSLRSTLYRIKMGEVRKNRRGTMLDLIEQVTLIRSGLTSHDGTLKAVRAENQARAVLRGSDFASDPIPPPSWLQQKMQAMWDSIGRWWDRVLKSMHIHFPHTSLPAFNVHPGIIRGFVYVLLFVVGILLVSLLIRFLVNKLQNYQFAQASSTPSTGLALNALEDALVSSRDYDRLLQLSKKSADEGDYRTGYRLVYVATLVFLDAAGVVRLHRPTTNWEHLAAVKLHERADLYPFMHPLTLSFDRIWYGCADTDYADYEEAERLYQKIHQTVLDSSPIPAGRRAIV